MKSSIRRWLHGSRLLLASGFAVVCFAASTQTANAQSLTLSFAFDQGAATSTSAPLTTEHITSANNGQTYLVDIFATVTGTTNLSSLGINNINFRGYASSVSTAAFTTASNGSVGVQNDANLQANSNSSSSSLQDSPTPIPVVSDGGSTANGTGALASGPGTSGVYGLPGTSNIGSDNFLVNFQGSATKWTVGGAAVSAYGTTVPSIATVNNPTEAGTPNAFQTRDSNGNLVAGSFTFLVGQFDYTIGTVSAGTSQAQLTSFVPTVSSAAGSNKIADYTDAVTGAFSNSSTTRAGVSGNATFSTGSSPYTIGSLVTFQVDAVAPSGNTSVIAATPSAITGINLGRMMQGALNSQLETVSLVSGNNTGATASVTGGTLGATLGSPNNGGSSTASGANFISGSQSWTTTVSLTNNIGAHSDTVVIQNTGDTGSGGSSGGTGEGNAQSAIDVGVTGNVLAPRTNYTATSASGSASLANMINPVSVSSSSNSSVSADLGAQPDSSYTRVQIAASGTTGAFTASHVGGGTLALGQSAGPGAYSVSGSFTGFSSSGNVSVGVTTGEAGGVNDNTSYSPLSIAYSFSAGQAGIDNSNGVNTFAAALTAPVSNSASYAGLASAAVGAPTGSGGSDARGALRPDGITQYGGTAEILAGVNSTANQGGIATVSMAWRTRVTSPTINQENKGGPGTAVPIDTVGLISDVVNLTGLTPGGEAGPYPETAPFTQPHGSDAFVMDMSYNNALIPKLGAGSEPGAASRGHIYLASLDGPVWENAVNANTGNSLNAVANFQGSFQTFVADNPTLFPGDPALSAITPTELANAMGSWGVDISTHEVWAVVDHNSEFAVVPEPATLLLAGLGLVGLIAVRRRKTA